MKHRHFDPENNEFYDHEHLHSGPHRHRFDPTVGRVVANLEPGNYAPARKPVEKIQTVIPATDEVMP